jgi:DNA-binding response OmpR family regulator
MNERRKIFMIDDEVDLCLLMKTYFLRKNYEVFIAHTFDDALPRVIQCQPDIICLTTAICRDPEGDIKRLKEAAPDAEIILDDFQKRNRF